MRDFAVKKCSFKISTEIQLLINFAFKHQKPYFEISFLSWLEDDHTNLQKNPYCSSKPDNRRNIYNFFSPKKKHFATTNSFSPTVLTYIHCKLKSFSTPLDMSSITVTEIKAHVHLLVMK